MKNLKDKLTHTHARLKTFSPSLYDKFQHRAIRESIGTVLNNKYLYFTQVPAMGAVTDGERIYNTRSVKVTNPAELKDTLTKLRNTIQSSDDTAEVNVICVYGADIDPGVLQQDDAFICSENFAEYDIRFKRTVMIGTREQIGPSLVFIPQYALLLMYSTTEA